jgi:tetratricopeptide (TPR) repeat protein
MLVTFLESPPKMAKTPLLGSPFKTARLSIHWRYSRRIALAIGFVLSGQSANAQERFLPQASAVVLAASVHTAGGRASSLRALDQAWRAQPQDMQKALAYARAVFTLGFNEGDLRWFGSAKAALTPWWQASDLPADGFFMRGLVKQGFHDFAGGLQDINQAISLNPERAEFWSWRFALHLLQANLSAARQDAEEIARRFGPEEGQIYRAVLLYRTGQALSAEQLLSASLRSPAYQDDASQVWIGFHLGEAHRVANQPDRAIAVWQRLLQAYPQSHLLRLSLADLLNQQGQFQQAQAVVSANSAKSHANLTDALLMQTLLASRGLKAPDESALAGQIAARLQSQALRQESLIERPKLIYQIAYGQDLAAGLTLSIENWQQQKEPPDAVLFAQAALALNQARAAEPVVQWAQTTGYTDPQLAPLLLQLMAHPSWSKERP